MYMCHSSIYLMDNHNHWNTMVVVHRIHSCIVPMDTDCYSYMQQAEHMLRLHIAVISIGYYLYMKANTCHSRTNLMDIGYYLNKKQEACMCHLNIVLMDIDNARYNFVQMKQTRKRVSMTQSHHTQHRAMCR